MLLDGTYRDRQRGGSVHARVPHGDQTRHFGFAGCAVQALLKRYRSLAAHVTVTSAGKTIKTVTVHIHLLVKRRH
jgi:hypothetical protein